MWIVPMPLFNWARYVASYDATVEGEKTKQKRNSDRVISNSNINIQDMSRDFTYINTTLKDLSIFRNTSVVILETITQKKKKKKNTNLLQKYQSPIIKFFFLFHLRWRNTRITSLYSYSSLVFIYKIKNFSFRFFHLFASDRTHVSSMRAHIHHRKANILGAIFVSSFRYFPNINN